MILKLWVQKQQYLQCFWSRWCKIHNIYNEFEATGAKTVVFTMILKLQVRKQQYLHCFSKLFGVHMQASLLHEMLPRCCPKAAQSVAQSVAQKLPKSCPTSESLGNRGCFSDWTCKRLGNTLGSNFNSKRTTHLYQHPGKTNSTVTVAVSLPLLLHIQTNFRKHCNVCAWPNELILK